MSINNTTRKTAVMYGNGTSVLFPFAFRINDEEDLKVYVKIGENGQYEEKELNTDYKLSNLVRDTNNNIISGDVEFPIIVEGEPDQPSPLTSNDSIYGLRETPKTQEESSAQVSFKSKDMERALDKATMQIQELQEEVDRSYKAPSYQSAIDEADFYTVAENIDKVNTVASNIPAIETSNDNAAAISTVANNISDVNTVGQNISNVNAVADDLTNIDTVKNNLTDIVTVSTSISDVNAVGQNITDVETVADNLTDISTVADKATDVTTVASISNAVTNVADNESNVNLVADNLTNVNTVASNMNSVLAVSGDISNVNTVASNTTNINTVAGISSNVTTVADMASDVTDVKDNATNITTVATNISNVNTVATNISNINTAASNMAAIIAAPTQASNAATSATNAQKWAEGTDADVTPLGGTHSSKGWANRAQEIAESLGAIYKPAGSIAFASLPALSADVLGNVYNITDSFTTTADFVEGAGDNYPAGTNVAIVDIGTGGSHNYKYDVLSGVVDLSAYRTSAAQDVIDANKADKTNKVNGIPISNANAYYYAESTSAADAVEKTVSIPAITELNAGQVIIVKPTVTSTVANSTLKLNSFNAYPMLYGGSNITTSTNSKVWSAYIPSIFVFDGSYWRFAGHGADDNTTYTLNYLIAAGTANAGVGNFAVTRYALLMQKLDGTWESLKETSTNYNTGTTKTVNTNGFIPGKIIYYNSTAVKKNGEALTASTLYLKATTVDARYSFNCGATPGWAVGDSIYIVGTIGTDGLFYLDSTTWWSNALPATQDGKVYMYIGTYVSDAYKISLDLDHPMFYHDGTSVKPYVVAGNKQDKLISGTNIKTINNTSLLGSGNIPITASSAWGSITGDLEDQTDLQNQLDSKAPAVLLSHFWSDHIINEMSCLRGDTFSWQSGDVYTAVYNHLVNDLTINVDTLYCWTRPSKEVYTIKENPSVGDNVYVITDGVVEFASTVNSISGDTLIPANMQAYHRYSDGDISDQTVPVTPQTETIGSYTITYYEAADKHKICLADQETTIYNLFNTTGNARYFILDTTNTRFKLARWKHNKYQAKAPVVGTGIALGFTNGQVNFGTMAGGNGLDTYQGDYGKAVGTTYSGTRTTTNKVCGIVTDPTKSGIEATLDADDMYLYFYVGTFTKTAYQETAGLNSELFNGKVDVNLNNITNADKVLNALAADFTSSITIAASNIFTAPSCGWINYAPDGNSSTASLISQGANGYIQIEGKTILTSTYVSGSDSTHPDTCWTFIGKGQTCYHTMSAGVVYFYPCKGV